LAIADDYIAAAFNYFPYAAAMYGDIMLARGPFTVDKH
jgi:hypothetical protein